jgi:hypothetical protein
MQNSKTILKVANIMPRLRLGNKTDKGVVPTGPHRVKFITDKEAKGTDPITGKERDEVAYLVEENGEKKSYRVPKFSKTGEIHYLVVRLAEIKEGEEVILEMKRSGIKNFVEVTPIKDSKAVEVDDDFNDDIPIIDENESTTDNPLI